MAAIEKVTETYKAGNCGVFLDHVDNVGGAFSAESVLFQVQRLNTVVGLSHHHATGLFTLQTAVLSHSPFSVQSDHRFMPPYNHRRNLWVTRGTGTHGVDGA